MRDSRDQRTPIAAMLVMVLLLGSYIGGYFAVLDDSDRRIGRIQGDLAERLPKYRSDAKVVEILFWPVHQADRLIRRERWAPEGVP